MSKKIGRIITKSKNIDTLDLVDIVSSVDTIDHSIPTLIIGKENAEKLFGKEKVHVLDKRIEDNVYWTFGKLERKNDFENDILSFNNMISKTIFNDVKYEYFNVFTAEYNDAKKILNDLNTGKNNIIYSFNGHLYILLEKKVIGININDLEYIGISKEKIAKYVKKNKNNKIITNDYFISKNTKKYLNGSKFIVPYIYFLMENE